MDFAGMRLGCRWPSGRIHAPVPMGVGAEPVPFYAWSRSEDAHRVSGNNAVIGDCVPTGCANAVQDWWADRSVMTPIPDAVPETIYSEVTGFVPGDPTTDQGTDPLAMFDWWHKNPIAGVRLNKAVPLDPQNESQLRRAIIQSGGIGLVIALSMEQQAQQEWKPIGTPGSWGEHFVWADTFDGNMTFCTTWGSALPIDRSYFQAPGFVIAAYEFALMHA